MGFDFGFGVKKWEKLMAFIEEGCEVYVSNVAPFFNVHGSLGLRGLHIIRSWKSRWRKGLEKSTNGRSGDGFCIYLILTNGQYLHVRTM